MTLAAVAATVLGVTGCSGGDDSGKKEPTVNGSTASQDSPGAKGSGGSGAPGGSGGANGSTGGAEGGAEGGASGPPRANGLPHSTAREAVATWVGAVVRGQPKRACRVMAQPASGPSPAQVGTPKRCDSDQPDMVRMRQSVAKFREAFSPKPPPSDPTVRVAPVPVNGGKAVVPAHKVTIDGAALDKVILSNSTGVKEGQVDVKVKVSALKGAWYVTDLDLKVG